MLYYLWKKQQTAKAKKRCWVRQIYEERQQKGEFDILVKDLRIFDHELFFKNFRKTPTKFEEFLRMVAPSLTKELRFQETISEEERLCVTLRHVVTGDSHTIISMSYRMNPTTVGRIIKETCGVIWDTLFFKGYLKAPTSRNKWKNVDIINHDLLVAKSHACGFNNDSLKLLYSYLNNRWHRIIINHKLGSWKELSQGVPQGSVPGPLLFNMYLNDLFFLSEFTNLCNFADDTTFYACNMDLNSLIKRIEHDNFQSIEWFENNNMKLN